MSVRFLIHSKNLVKRRTLKGITNFNSHEYSRSKEVLLG